MLRRLYDWTMRLAEGPRAPWALSSVSFIESSVFPIPPDVLLIPMVIANRARWAWYAFICTVSSVAGALLGYAIGMFLYDQIAQPVLEMYGKTDAMAQIKAQFDKHGYWAVLFAAITPFPFKVLTIFSGFAALNIPIFLAASVVGRAFRFYLVSWLLYLYGQPIREFIERRLHLLTTVFLVLLIGGFLALRYLV